MAVSDRIIERVRKMLALAHDKGASEGERDNALRMVHAYLAKYNLDLTQIESQPSGKEPRTYHTAQFYGRPWARAVAKSVGQMLFCISLYKPAPKAKETVFFFVGRHSNAVSAAILSEFLIDSITREGRRRQRELNAGNAWFRSFATGAALAIGGRVEKLLRDGPDAPATPVATPGTSVVLASVYERERAANRSYIDAARGGREPPKARGRAKGSFVSDAVSEGVAYGHTVSLNHQLGGK